MTINIKNKCIEIKTKIIKIKIKGIISIKKFQKVFIIIIYMK